jgi:hypothetical protein
MSMLRRAREKKHEPNAAHEGCTLAMRFDSHDADARVERLDFGTLKKPERTPQGGLRVPAYLTRTGVFTYTRGDGTTVRELRHPDEVFHKDSLRTLAAAPVTDQHPKEMVRADNWKTYSVGHVSERIDQESGRYVAADLYIQDAKIVEAVESRKLCEISCGYSCAIDPTSGVFRGEHYDAIQRSIRYNHAALGPEGWGRAGSEVRLRLDSGDAIQRYESSEEKRTMATIRIDGVDYTIDNATAAQAIDRALGKADSEITALKASAESLQGKLDAHASDLAETKKKLAEAEDPKRLDSLARARAELLTQARAILGKDAASKLDGKTDREILEAVVTSKMPNVKLDGRSDDYVRACFDSFVTLQGDSDHTRTRADGDVRRVIREATGTRNDGERLDAEAQARKDADEAWERRQKRNAEGWKQPLNTTTQRT